MKSDVSCSFKTGCCCLVCLIFEQLLLPIRNKLKMAVENTWAISPANRISEIITHMLTWGGKRGSRGSYFKKLFHMNYVMTTYCRGGRNFCLSRSIMYSVSFIFGKLYSVFPKDSIFYSGGP